MKKRSLPIVLFCILALVTGCANIRDDATRTKAEGAGTGAAAGALIGALIGQLAGGDTSSTLLGAAIGAAVGGAGGYAYGSHVAAEKEKYASQEDWINASIAEAEQRNGELRAYSEKLRQELAQLRKELKGLKRRYKQGKVEKDALLAKKGELDKLFRENSQRLAAARDELKAQRSVLDDVSKNGGSDLAPGLEAQIRAIKAEITKLEQQNEELASMSESMAV
ncbi:YMGG-like glycine zipper-containing protein [Thermodesulfobacteriota bacterium B35]